MKTVATKIKKMNIVFTKGKPTGVILGINDFKELLERAEDAEDLNELNKIRANPTSFRGLEDFFSEIKK